MDGRDITRLVSGARFQGLRRVLAFDLSAGSVLRAGRKSAHVKPVHGESLFKRLQVTGIAHGNEISTGTG